MAGVQNTAEEKQLLSDREAKKRLRKIYKKLHKELKKNKSTSDILINCAREELLDFYKIDNLSFQFLNKRYAELRYRKEAKGSTYMGVLCGVFSGMLTSALYPEVNELVKQTDVVTLIVAIIVVGILALGAALYSLL